LGTKNPASRGSKKHCGLLQTGANSLKKVIHVITTIERGGAENQLLILVKEQIRLNYVVEILYLKGKPELAAEFTEIGATVNHAISGLNIILQIIKTKNYLRKKDVVLHAHLPRAELLAAICKNNNSLIFSRHNAEPFFPGAPKLVSSMLSKFVVKRSECGIAISKSVLKYLDENHELIPDFRMLTILYGFDSKNNYVDKVPQDVLLETNFEPGSFIVGTVSRLTDQKDLLTLLNSFRIVKNTINNAKLIIVGVGPLKEKLEEKATEFGIESDIYWVGKTANVFNYMQIFNVFVLTSKYEGFGLVLLEAMSMKLPIVSSRNSAIPEVLGYDYIGLCETGNEIEFASKITNVIDLQIREKSLNQLALREPLFTPEIMGAKIDQIYEGLEVFLED
jgi:glycosyltransferase involved in cell wall biosynthesis